MTDEEFAKSIGATLSDDEFAQSIGAKPIEEAPLGKRLKSGVKKAWEGIKSTADVGISMPAAGLAGLFGDTAGQEDIFKQLNSRIAGREKAAEGPDPGFLGRLAGVGATLPAQIAAMPFSGIETAKQFVDQGENLPRAYAAGGLDTAGNMLGMALPGVIPGSRAVRALSGAGINAAQDTATRLGISGIAQQDKTKEMFAPSWETAALSAVPGAALGALTKGKTKAKTPTPKPDADSVVGAFKVASKEAPGRVDLEVGGDTPPVMRVGKDGEAYPATFENEVARKAAEQRMVDMLEQQREAEMPQRIQNAVQEELPFYSSVEDIAAKQAIPEQADMFLGNELPQTPETIARQQQLDIQNQKEQLFQSRPQTDENIAQRQAQEQAKAQQEQQLIDLQQTLMEGAYKPTGDGQGPKTRAARMNKFGQGGAINPQLFDDAFKAVKAIGKGFSLVLKGKSYGPEIEVLGPSGDVVGSAAFETTTGKLKDTSANLTSEGTYVDKPFQRKGLAAEMYQFLAEKGADIVPSTDQSAQGRAMWSGFEKYGISENNKINKFGQGGGIDPDLLTFGIPKLINGFKTRFTGNKTVPMDSVMEPTSAGNIAAKKAKAAKYNAIGMKDSVYSNPTTIEEVLANLPTKDIGSVQDYASGNEGVIRRNSTNTPLKFVRWLRSKAQTNTDALTTKYITGKGGFNDAFRALSQEEKMRVHEVIQSLSSWRQNYSPELAAQLGLNDKQMAFMEARGRALEAVLGEANRVNQALGFETIERLPGYSPGMFASTYVSLVGHYKDVKGVKTWVTDAVVNANSKWEYDQGIKHYKEKGGFEFINMDRRGLGTTTKAGRNFDGTMKLLAALAEKDERFAQAKGVLDQFLKDQTKKLYNFDVHELRKKGVEGNIGNKPWKDAANNAKEALEAEVNYIDEGFKYWNYQEMLNKTKQLVDTPELANLPNTRKYMDKYIKQVTGNNLHPVGAAANSIIDMAFEAIGKGGAKVGLDLPENPNRVFAGAREFGSALMMNIYAPAFAAIQLVQMFQGGIPEAMKIRNEMGLSPDAPVTALGKAMVLRGWMWGLDRTGKLEDSKIPPHMKDAYKWMKSHGVDHYNEIQMSHEAAQNPKWTQAKNAAFWPTRLPEQATRPTVFLWYADMFHQAGLKGEELHITAKNATDYAMVNYHTDERPMVYQELGVAGQGIGALRTFSHNQIEQMVSRTKEAKQNPGAFLAMMGFAAGLSGLAGLPFYDEIDELIIQPVTGKTGRDWMDVALHPVLINGAASAYSDVDIQSRFSMADMVPDGPVQAVAGPQLTKMFQILDTSFKYIKDQDVKSFNEMARAALPSGMVGAFEDANLTDKEGFVLDKEGQRKYMEPRSEEERTRRKVLGLRPLRERLEDSDLYATRKMEKKLTDKQKDAYSRMKASINLQDNDGFNNAYLDYMEADGDPTIIKRLMKQNAKQKNLSTRQREVLAPGKTIPSIKKYERYWE